MNCSVNLVPRNKLHTRRRARRRASWISVCLTAAAVGGLGVAMQFTARRAMAHIEDETEALTARRNEIRAQLATKHEAETELIGRLQTVAAAHRPQPWPRRLLALSERLPESIFLSVVQISPPERKAGPDRSIPRARASREGAQPHPVMPDLAPQPQTVKLRGFAMDHSELLQFIRLLQGMPDWQEVKLVRATREPYGLGQAVRFELACRTAVEGAS